MSETKTTVIPDPGEYKFILIIEEDGTEASAQHWIDNNAGGSIRRALSLGKAQAVSITPLPWDPGGWPTRYTRSNVDLPIDWVDASKAFEVHVTTDQPFEFTWDDHKAHVYGVSRIGNAVQNDSLFNALSESLPTKQTLIGIGNKMMLGAAALGALAFLYLVKKK